MGSRVSRKCKACGRDFEIERYRFNRGEGSYCSSLCNSRVNQPKAVLATKRKAELLRSRCKLPEPTLDTQYIPLNDEVYVAVSPCDYEWLVQWNWCPNGHGYATNTARPRKLMHVLIVERATGRPKPREHDVDHRNHNGLDNRRPNLRLATKTQNQANSGVPKHNRSGYKGVSYSKPRCKWLVSIKVNNRTVNCGRYATPEEGAYVYDQFMMQLHGEFAYTNFDY